MLKECADGFDWEFTGHSIKISYNGKSCYFPRGPKRDTRWRFLVKMGQVENLVTQLEIDENCVEATLN